VLARADAGAGRPSGISGAGEGPLRRVRRPVPPGKFCMAGGRPLSGKTHCTCGVALKPDARFCSNCGTKV
jgi:hypothetical protein